MSYEASARALKAIIDANQTTVDLINEVGGIRDDWEQSDRLGFDWHNFYINNELYRRDYVEQPYPYPGSQDKPFEWRPDMQLIPNGFYIYEGVRKVWLGALGVTAGWDDPNFVTF